MPNRDKPVAPVHPAHPVQIDEATLERLNRGILMRTGAYQTDDHIVLRSGRHTAEYVAKTLVTTEPTFTEGLGDILATHFSRSPVDLVLRRGTAPDCSAIASREPIRHVPGSSMPSRPRSGPATQMLSSPPSTVRSSPRADGF